MLRITDLKLPLDHDDDALAAAVRTRLGVKAAAIVKFEVFRRAWDARKKSAILLIYTVDVEVQNEAAVLKRFARDPHVRPTPDMAYKQVARASSRPRLRPVVIGAGPCGLFAMLILAEMGLEPILLERGKVVRERTKDTWGLWRRSF